MFETEAIPDNPTNIQQCWRKIDAINAEIKDAHKSLAAIASAEVGELIPTGTLSILDALRAAEAKFSEDSPEEKARKQQVRIDAVKVAIANLENERESILAKKEGMNERCKFILSHIAKVGERALKAQKEFYKAISELEELRGISNEYQRLQDSRSSGRSLLRAGQRDGIGAQGLQSRLAGKT